MLSDLYVIFQGAHTDWFIKVKNRKEALVLKTMIKTWSKNRHKTIIRNSIFPLKNLKFEKFPDGKFQNLIDDLKRSLK